MRVSGIPYVQGRNAYSDADGTKYGIAIHNTANTATAAAEASYATRRTDGISSHFYADGTQVIQSLDTVSRAGHAGSSEGNQNAVAVEITGTNDKSRQWWLDNVAWDQLGRVLAQVCTHYGIALRRASVSEMASNPKVRAFYSHDDMRRAWGSTTHTDPGPNFPWDRLFSAVNAALTDTPTQEDDMSWDETLTTTGGKTASAERFVTDTADRTYIVANVQMPAMAKALDALAVQLAALSGRDMVDEPAIVAGVLAGLSPAAIAAAIPAELARQVADELAARLQS